jgi:hypothetical protein
MKTDPLALFEDDMDIGKIRYALGEKAFDSFCDLVMDIPEWAFDDATEERAALIRAFKKAITQ